MYAYSAAAAKAGVVHVLREKDSELIQQVIRHGLPALGRDCLICGCPNLLSLCLHPSPNTNTIPGQPPADDSLNKAAMYHYTWGTQFKKGSDVVWQFDKRTFTEVEKVRQPKKHRLEMPPAEYAELRVQDGRSITPKLVRLRHYPPPDLACAPQEQKASWPLCGLFFATCPSFTPCGRSTRSFLTWSEP